MYEIDITMTAAMRLEVFKKTLDSFFRFMFDKYLDAGNKLNLVLNIDPVGNDLIGQDLSNCIRGRFNKILVNIADEPSFPRAFKRVWSNVSPTSDYAFHLEDDWELVREIDLMSLIHILQEEDDLALLRLAAFPAGEAAMKNWNKFFPYNGKYYECPEEMRTSVGFCGHPSLIKTEFVRTIAPFLDDSRNPEKQFHSRGCTKIMEEIVDWRYGVYSIPDSSPLIRDLGRRWMVENGFVKQGAKAHFVNWEKES